MNRLFEVLSGSRTYHENKPLASGLLRMLDVLLLLLPQRKRPLAGSPRKILLMSAAYNGDLLMSTSVLPLIHRAYPGCEIGFLVGSWSRQVVDGHPLVDRVHVIDVFRLNRSKIGLWNKLRQQWRTQRVARREIQAQQYDMAIDLFTGFPPLSWFAWSCAVPVRIGYSSRGFGAMLTDPVSLKVKAGRHEIDYHVDLLRLAGIEPSVGPHFSSLGPVEPANCASAAAKLGWQSLDDHRYVVVHPGAGEPLKEWPVGHWRAVITELVRRSDRILLFTGHGEREAVQIARITEGQSRCLNLAGRLTWNELGALFSGADLVIGVDSMSGHLAAAHRVPTLTLSTGMSDPDRWRPANAAGTVLHTQPPCLPCLNRVGCPSMRCLREIPTEAVVQAALARLAA